MYSPRRSHRNNFGESDSEDSVFDYQRRQQSPKMCNKKPMYNRREKKQHKNTRDPSGLEAFNYPGKSRKRDNSSLQLLSLRDLSQKSFNGHRSSPSVKESTAQSTINGYGYVHQPEKNESTGSSSNEKDLVNDNNSYNFDELSGVIYGKGDTSRTHSELDGSSVVSERSDDWLKDSNRQPWMDKITGGTFRREYSDKKSLRPSLQSENIIFEQNVHTTENRSVETQTQDPYYNGKRDDKRTNKTGLVVLLGILLIVCIAGVLAWFLAKKGDGEFSVKYYVVSGEMALINDFYPELSIASSKEFTNLSVQFCGAITDALRTNITEYGDLYRHCNVIEFKNGSIIVQFRLYYVYNEVQIKEEKVYQDLNNSLIDVDSGFANFSNFVIIKASVGFQVELQTFKTDPLLTGAPLITSTSATAATELEPTVMSSNDTTLLTGSTTLAVTTEGATGSIQATLETEIDPLTLTTTGTTEKTQAPLVTEITTESDAATFTKEGTTETQSTESRIETTQRFTNTITNQTSTTLNTLETSASMVTTDLEFLTTSKTMATSDNFMTPTSTDTTDRFSQSPTLNKTEKSTTITTIDSTESSSTTTYFETSENFRTTTLPAPETAVEYSADVLVSPLIAIYGETTATKTCVVTPRGDWVHVALTVENHGTTYVIVKYHSNKSFEEQASLERFNASISSTDTEIEVYLTLNLQAPTTDMCSWDGRYTFSCSITMNDTIQTRVYNGSQIFITAPMSETFIDSEVRYNEGDILTFNCSSNGDPNYSTAYVELIKNLQTLEVIPGPNFKTEYKSNCSVDFNWLSSAPNPLTINQHGVIVRCVVKNSLLNEKRTSEKMLNVSAADIAFETYNLESSIGSQLSVKCFLRDMNSIKTILIRKIENLVNRTVANITLPDMTSHMNGTTISYTNNSLTLTFSSLTCSDDGHYTCIVIREDKSYIESPANLHVQLLNPPKHEAVTFILNPDIKENRFDTRNVHTCSGDVGYPVGLGYLSLKFIDPTTNGSFTYDKMTVTEDMKMSLQPPLKFQVSLASGLSIIIVEDGEPDTVNCTRNKEIKFLLQATRDWNKAYIRCSVISETGEVNRTAVQEELYVIPDSICSGSNGSDVYLPHEKIDGCKTYVRCYNNISTGLLCQPNTLCFDHLQNTCSWCTSVNCESETSLTTEQTPSTPAVEETQCPIISCNSTSVYNMETAHIACDMNTSATYDSISVMKNRQPLMTAYSNGTNHYYTNGTNSYEGTLGPSFTFAIKDVICSDKSDYMFTVEDGGTVMCSKTSLLDIKAKPTKPKLVIDYRWTDGTNLGTHSCIGSIGNPLGTMTLEIRNGESENFTSFIPSTKQLSYKMENCNNNATLSFSIDFSTEKFKEYYIRCVADNTHTLPTSESPFYSDSVLINPLPENPCLIDGIQPYPGDCTRFLSCSNNITNVLKCSIGGCFDGELSTCVTNNCTSICST